MVEIRLKTNVGRVTIAVKNAFGLDGLDHSVLVNFYHSPYLVMIKQHNKTYTIPMSNVMCILVENTNE
mgnify:CR=1 FL=1